VSSRMVLNWTHWTYFSESCSRWLTHPSMIVLLRTVEYLTLETSVNDGITCCHSWVDLHIQCQCFSYIWSVINIINANWPTLYPHSCTHYIIWDAWYCPQLFSTLKNDTSAKSIGSTSKFIVVILA